MQNASDAIHNFKNSPIPDLHLATEKDEVNPREQDWLNALNKVLSYDPEAIVTRVEQGADIEARDSYGETALMAAAGMNDTKTMALLLHHHASLSPRDNQGRTAFDIAIQNKNLKAVDYFCWHCPRLFLDDQFELSADFKKYEAIKHYAISLRLELTHSYIGLQKTEVKNPKSNLFFKNVFKRILMSSYKEVIKSDLLFWLNEKLSDSKRGFSHEQVLHMFKTFLLNLGHQNNFELGQLAMDLGLALYSHATKTLEEDPSPEQQAIAENQLNLSLLLLLASGESATEDSRVYYALETKLKRRGTDIPSRQIHAKPQVLELVKEYPHQLLECLDELEAYYRSCLNETKFYPEFDPCSYLRNQVNDSLIKTVKSMLLGTGSPLLDQAKPRAKRDRTPEDSEHEAPASRQRIG